jgi:hypothetical protein
MIPEIVMQIDFTNIASPEVFDSSLATLISILMGVIAYAGVRFRSPAVFAVWALAFMVLILSFITSLPFIWFWIVMLLNALTVSVSASVRYLL